MSVIMPNSQWLVYTPKYAGVPSCQGSTRKGGKAMKDVYFRCSKCGGRMLERNIRNYTFRETDVPLRCIIEKIEKLYGEILCRKCQGGNEMDNGKNFDGYLEAMQQVSDREREKLLDKARNDKGITVAGYLKLENYVISMAGKAGGKK